jgi:hypothetical protein
MTATPNPFRPTNESVLTALTSLGDTAAKVAENLLDLGHRGSPGVTFRCPVAVFLSARFPGSAVSVSAGWVLVIGAGVDAPMPAPVAEFVNDFDRGVPYTLPLVKQVEASGPVVDDDEEDEEDEPHVCVGCGADTTPCQSSGWDPCPPSCDHTGAWEWYIVHDEVWAEAGAGELDVLCIGCLEGRLGRPLVGADFSALPINEPSPWDSPRLVAAKERS